MLIGEQDYETMTPVQKSTYDTIAAGPRAGVPLPFLAMLDAPDFANAVQGVGAAIRFKGSLPDRLREVAILAAAAAYGSGYEWGYHDEIADQLGLTKTERAAILDGSGTGLLGAETTCVQYVMSAVTSRRADPKLLGKLVTAIGRQQATELTLIAGYYPLLALFLSAGELDSMLPHQVA